MAKAATAPTIVRQGCAVIGGIIDGENRTGSGPGAGSPQKLECHDPHVPVYAYDTDTVVADGTNGTSTMGTVAMVVIRITIIVDEVVAVDIVDVAIAIIVDSIPRDFAGIHPHVGGEVLMIPVHTRVDDTNDNRPCSSRNVPRFGSINIDIVHTTCLAGVMQTPEAVERRIVGLTVDRNHVVGLGVAHAWRAAILEDLFRQLAAVQNSYLLHTRLRRCHHFHAQLCLNISTNLGRHRIVKSNQQFVGDMIMREHFGSSDWRNVAEGTTR